jgi:CO/xanthine dehydrogenase Mo-binding subunit
VRVKRVAAAHAIGRVVNPMLAESQVYGGMMMGVGYSTTETRVIDENTGLQLTTNLEDYKPPTIMDTPEYFVDFVDTVDPEANSVGGKGLGEPPIIPTAPAIANAIADAIGVRVRTSPITPDRVLQALAEKGEEA